MRPKVGERQEQLLDVVRGRGSIRVAELAERLRVSPVTVRRDVEALAGRGLLDRAHGEVSWPSGPPAPARRAEAAAGAGGPGLVLGMVVPSAACYVAEIVAGAREAADAAGARLVLGLADRRAGQDAAQVRRLLGGGVHGMLLAPGGPAERGGAERGDWAAALAVPAVLTERRALPGTPLDELDRVCSDHAHGVLLAVRHLAGLGHRRIALAARDDSPTAAAVREGWPAACRRLGIPDRGPVLTAHAAGADPDAHEATLDALHRAVRADGVTAALVHNDTAAIELMQGLHARGVRVPDDVAVIAYDDELAALADTPLTAVAPPKRAVGRAAVETLLRRVADGDASPRRHLDLLPRLHVRRSCRRPQ